MTTRFFIRPELAADSASRERLLDMAFGENRHRKTSARLRENRLPARGLAFAAVGDDARLIGTVRLWDVIAGSAGPSLLLGPLAVDASFRNIGLGCALMHHALKAAQALGHGSVLLVGDESYYGRFGFSPTLTRKLKLPGPVQHNRFLACELIPGALQNAEGMVLAAGARAAGAFAAKAA